MAPSILETWGLQIGIGPVVFGSATGMSALYVWLYLGGRSGIARDAFAVVGMERRARIYAEIGRMAVRSATARPSAPRRERPRRPVTPPGYTLTDDGTLIKRAS